MDSQEKKQKFDMYMLVDSILLVTLLLLLISWWLGIIPQKINTDILAVFSVLGILPVLRSAFVSFREKRVSIDLLASIALIFTYLQGEWVSSGFINLMLTSSRLFDVFTKMRTKRIINRLLKYRPEKVKVKRDGSIEEISLEHVKQGDLVVIQSGERIPIDGVVLSGVASIDQSTLTGESETVSKKTGDEVFSSTLAVSGSLLVKAEKVGNDTTLSKIIGLIDEASRSKTKVGRIADTFSIWYIAITLAGSAILYLVSGDLGLVLSVLLVTCADDIAVAVPLGFTMAIARGARDGIIIKGAVVFEALRKITAIVTDKTGTLTKGAARVVQIVSLKNIPESELYTGIGIVQINSRHPIGGAIINFLKSKQVHIEAPDEFHETPGEGITATKGNTQYAAGKIEFLEENNIAVSSVQKEQVTVLRNKGYSLVGYGKNRELEAVIVLEYELRPFVKESVQETREMGIKKWIMLTGDNEVIAQKVCAQTDIDEYRANLKPEDKLKQIKEIKKEYKHIAMMGDGVNDAAALALSDVSIAMGAIGSDAAIEAADIALMHDSIRKVPETMLLSRKTMKIIKQNFLIWGITNVVGLFLVFSGIIGPSGAAAYNFITDFIPILNVFQIYFIKTNKHAYDLLVKK